HRLSFSLELQTRIKFIITTSTNTFATIYSALLVLVTQTHSMQRSLHIDRTLTAMHDNAAAWTGIGSAALYLWRQKAIPATPIGVLSTFLYLGNILLLHITIPGLFSLETIISSQYNPVETRGLPAFNGSLDADPNYPRLLDYARGSLYFLGSVLGSETTIGLHEGTLYEVPEPNGGTGNATVDATGFNITCGLPTQVDVTFSWASTEFSANASAWFLALDKDNDTSECRILSTQPGMISLAYSDPPPIKSIVLYSTMPIIDTDGQNGSWVQLRPPMNNSLSSIQVLKCSQSLVTQKAVVDAQSGKFLSVSPDIHKTASTWLPYSEQADITEEPAQSDKLKTGNEYIDAWASWYTRIPPDLGSSFPLDPDPRYVDPPDLASVADVYLLKKLNLRPWYYDGTSNGVFLHDLENALSIIVASMFWNSHVPPTLGEGGLTSTGNDGPWFATLTGEDFGPILLKGNTSVTETFPLTRVNIIAGLVVSVALTMLSLVFSFSGNTAANVRIRGTGILQAIWLYRNDAELERLLPQVENPTERNLRQAGMVARGRLTVEEEAM
ncbi:hypothetical protein B0H14DRAFT_3732658, partial [Mycena olivaceomarginata]